MSSKTFLVDLGGLRQELLDLGRDAPMVMARALNRAGTAGKTAMVRAAAKDSGLANKYIARDIRVDKANKTEPRVTVEVVGARLPLIAFDARGPEPSKGKGRGVSWRGRHGRVREQTAFIATVGTGQHRGVFRRLRPTRSRKGLSKKGQRYPPAGLPITELFGPSIPTILEKQLPVFQAAAEAALLKNLRHDIDFVKSKRGGGGVPDAA